MWDLSPLTRDQPTPPALQGEVLTTGLQGSPKSCTGLMPTQSVDALALRHVAGMRTGLGESELREPGEP